MEVRQGNDKWNEENTVSKAKSYLQGSLEGSRRGAPTFALDSV